MHFVSANVVNNMTLTGLSWASITPEMAVGPLLCERNSALDCHALGAIDCVYLCLG